MSRSELDQVTLLPTSSRPRTRWVTGHEPMTGAQASYLKTLSEEAHDRRRLTLMEKAEASKRIDCLK
jgi:Protein of unknown function (DUF3072)